MTVAIWVISVVAYFAIAVGIMRWRTYRIDQGKPWRILMADEHPNEKQRKMAHSFTTAIGFFWPLSFVYVAVVDVVIIVVWLGWRAIDWTMRKLAGLPPR